MSRLATRGVAILFAAFALTVPAVAIWTGQTPLVLLLSGAVGVTGVVAGIRIDRVHGGAA